MSIIGGVLGREETQEGGGGGRRNALLPLLLAVVGAQFAGPPRGRLLRVGSHMWQARAHRSD